jgi:hypothetical protein
MTTTALPQSLQVRQTTPHLSMTQKEVTTIVSTSTDTMHQSRALREIQIKNPSSVIMTLAG